MVVKNSFKLKITENPDNTKPGTGFSYT